MIEFYNEFTPHEREKYLAWVKHAVDSSDDYVEAAVESVNDTFLAFLKDKLPADLKHACNDDADEDLMLFYEVVLRRMATYMWLNSTAT